MKLLDCHGFEFKAKIVGIKCAGKVSIEYGKPFLCQDRCSGNSCEQMFDLDYSWILHNPSLVVCDVINLEVKINGEFISIQDDWEEFNINNHPIEVTPEDIARKFNVNVEDLIIKFTK